MRSICFFNSTLFWGGGEKLHADLASALINKGYKVSFICGNNSKLSERLSELPVSILKLDITNLSFLNPSKIRKIRRYLRNTNVDTLFFSTSQDFKIACLAAKSLVQNIIYLRGLTETIANKILNKYLLNNCVSHFVASSKVTLKQSLRHFQSEPIWSKSSVIHHGIPLTKVDGLALQDERDVKSTENKTTILIGTAGRLSKEKGHNLLIDTAKYLRDKKLNFQIHIAGTGPLQEELSRQIDQLDLQDQVSLLGFIKDTSSFFREIDIFALPSLHEGFGFATVEAMAACRPVVAFNHSSNPEIVDNGITGILVDFPDTEQFAEAIGLLCKDSELRRQMGKAARKRVEENFDINTIVCEFEKLLSN